MTRPQDRSGGNLTDDRTAPSAEGGDRSTTQHEVPPSPAAASPRQPGQGPDPLNNTTPREGQSEQLRTGGSGDVEADGHGTLAGRWTCVCGHRRTNHHGWGWCDSCDTCDRFRAPDLYTNEAAGSAKPTAS